MATHSVTCTTRRKAVLPLAQREGKLSPVTHMLVPALLWRGFSLCKSHFLLLERHSRIFCDGRWNQRPRSKLPRCGSESPFLPLHRPWPRFGGAFFASRHAGEQWLDVDQRCAQKTSKRLLYNCPSDACPE